MGTTQSEGKKLVTLESYPPRRQHGIHISHDESFWYHCKQNGENSFSILYNPEQSWIRIVEGSLSAFDFNNTDVIALNERELVPDQSPTLWVLTHYCHKTTKIVNESKHNVTINSTKGDPLILSPRAAVRIEDKVGMVREKGGAIVPRTSHEVDGLRFLTFCCVSDDAGGITVAVRDTVGS